MSSAIELLLLGILEEEVAPPGGGGSSPSIVSSATSSSGGSAGTSHNVSFPVNLGNWIVIFATFGRGTAGAITLSEASGTWTISHSGTDNSNYRSAVIYKKLVSGDTSPLTITTSTNSFSARVRYELSLPNDDFQVSSFDNVDGNGPPNHSPTGGNVERLWFASSFFTFAESAATITEPSSYGTAITVKSETNSTTAGRVTASAASRLLTATSEDPGAFGYSGGTGVQMNAVTASGR